MHLEVINGRHRASRSTRRRLAVAGLGLVVAAASVACGSDDDGAAATAASDTSASDASATGAGSAPGTDTATDPSTGMSTGVASTATDPQEADPLAPRPLPEELVVRVNAPARLTGFAPLYVGDLVGEFAKENIRLEHLFLPSTDAITELVNGGIDVLVRGLDAGHFNSLAAGFDSKLVYPVNRGSYGDDKSGIWFSQDLIAGGAERLRGATFGSAVGVGGGNFSYLLNRHLQEVGLTLSDVKFQTIPSPELPAALEAGAVDGAFLTSPSWLQVDGKGFADLALSTIDEFPAAGYVFGPSLLEADHAVGEAFVRALARTERDHLHGDYLADPETRQLVAEALEQDEEALTGLPTLAFDAEPRVDWDAEIAAMQAAWLQVGDVLEYEEPLPASEVVDASYIEAVLG